MKLLALLVVAACGSAPRRDVTVRLSTTRTEGPKDAYYGIEIGCPAEGKVTGDLVEPIRTYAAKHLVGKLEPDGGPRKIEVEPDANKLVVWDIWGVPLGSASTFYCIRVLPDANVIELVARWDVRS